MCECNSWLGVSHLRSLKQRSAPLLSAHSRPLLTPGLVSLCPHCTSLSFSEKGRAKAWTSKGHWAGISHPKAVWKYRRTVSTQRSGTEPGLGICSGFPQALWVLLGTGRVQGPGDQGWSESQGPSLKVFFVYSQTQPLSAGPAKSQLHTEA